MTNNNILPELKPDVANLDVSSSITTDKINASQSDIYAAVDLGSNSFHLVISRYQLGEFVVLDRQKEVVRLAAGLDENNLLSNEVSDRALQCLLKFGQLLRGISSQRVRVVGTNALRRLQNKHDFLEQAEKALGHSIEIIAGREEARLIYLGVSKWSDLGDESRLVIDIGGGSTEIIAGKGDVAHCRESLEVGCVVLSKRFFSDGVLTKARFKKAITAAELEIQPVVNQFRLQGWNQVIGCSGTMKSISQAIIDNGWSKDGINRDGLHSLFNYALECATVDQLDIAGLTADRRPVFAGGLAILLALFDIFEIQQMSVSEIALREGVLYDLAGPSAAEDTRNMTVSAMLSRWAVDPAHGQSVAVTALQLFDHVAMQWDIQNALFRNILGWAAQLHELGLLISHDGYHKHGAYMIANADMAGFARRDQLLLAALIEGHRSKFPINLFEQLPSVLVTPAKRSAIILRLAVLLHRGRNSSIPENLQMHIQGQTVHLQFNGNWLIDNPLTQADLEQEQHRLKVIGVKLSFH